MKRIAFVHGKNIDGEFWKPINLFIESVSKYSRAKLLISYKETFGQGVPDENVTNTWIIQALARAVQFHQFKKYGLEDTYNTQIKPNDDKFFNSVEVSETNLRTKVDFENDQNWKCRLVDIEIENTFNEPSFTTVEILRQFKTKGVGYKKFISLYSKLRKVSLERAIRYGKRLFKGSQSYAEVIYSE